MSGRIDARRPMAYRFTLHHSVADEARRIAVAEIDKALRRCGNEGDRAEAAHELRKRCKRMRGLVRLLRGPLEASGAYAAENEYFRDAARELGAVRDSQAMIATYDSLMERFHDEVDRRRFAPIRRALTLRSRQLREDDDLAARLAHFRGRMVDARERVADWKIEEDGFEAVREGLVRTYRSGRRAMADAIEAPTGETFHAWRKQAKYHWYHMRLIERIWKRELHARRQASKKLGVLLGDHHDLAVLHRRLDGANDGGADRNREMSGLIERRSAELVGRATVIGERLYAARPKSFGGEMAEYWHARVDEIAAERHRRSAMPAKLDPD